VWFQLLALVGLCEGFQRTDFTTDLRGGGLLGPLQMLYFLGAADCVDYPCAVVSIVARHAAEHHRDFVQRMFRLSQSPPQDFPLMVQSIQITARSMNVCVWGCTGGLWCATVLLFVCLAGAVLQAMRQGKLNAVANASGNMITSFHQFYMAMFFEFYDTWVSRDATIAEMHYVMESVEKVCRKDPAAAIAKYGFPLFCFWFCSVVIAGGVVRVCRFQQAMSKPLAAPTNITFASIA
jgi:hypothetical protein